MSDLIVGGIAGSLTSTVALAAVAFLSKEACKNWLHHFFEKELTDYKHQQEKELREIGLNVATTLSRAGHIIDKEFEVLSEMWVLLTKANDATMRSAMGVVPPFDASAEGERLTSFLDRIGMADCDREELSAADNRQSYFQDWAVRNNYAGAMNSVRYLRQFLQNNSLFIDDLIGEKIKAFYLKMLNALEEKEAEARGENPGHDERRKFRQSEEQDLNDISRDLKKRIWVTSIDQISFRAVGLPTK